MYPVSNAFLEAVKAKTRKYYWTGRITTKGGNNYDFGPNDTVKGSGNISAQCCGSSEIEIGTVYASEFVISLYQKFFNGDRYTLNDAEIRPKYHLRISTSLNPADVDPNYNQDLEEDGIYEWVPVGVFEMSEVNWTVKCIEIKSYDYMLRFEKNFKSTDSAGLAYDFISLCATACHVQLEQSRADFEAMPNGSIPLSLYQENDIETYRDVLYYIGQVLGGFWVINRYGKLELRKYGNQSVLTVEQWHRFTSSFSDFVTRYTAISSTNLKTQMSEYYHLDPDNGLTMNLGVNPFLQFGVKETREYLCNNILNDIAVVNYVPFSSDTIGNPALDIGDVLSFDGGQADNTKISAITSSNIKLGGKHTIKCAGKNPQLAQAKSKNDKNIAGLLNSIEQGKISIHTFTNAEAYNVANADTRIISIQFATTEADKGQFFGQVIVDVTADSESKSITVSGDIVVPADDIVSAVGSAAEGTTEGEDVTVSVSLPVTWTEDGHADVVFTFELNDVREEMHRPQESWHSGRHTILLYYPIESVIPDFTNTFNVYMRVSGGTARIEPKNCIGSISGQSMGAGAAWDGTFEFEDSISKIVFGRNAPGRLRTRTLVGTMSIEEFNIMPLTLSDVKRDKAELAAYAKPVDVMGSNFERLEQPYASEIYGDDDGILI